MQSRAKTNSVFVDFRKAFDSVDLNVLLDKFYHISIRGIPQKLLTDQLANRFQHVKIEEECSARKQIKRGVPKGPILGKLLFLVLINDLGAHENWQRNVVKYADDISMIGKLNLKSADKNLLPSGMTNKP